MTSLKLHPRENPFVGKLKYFVRAVAEAYKFIQVSKCLSMFPWWAQNLCDLIDANKDYDLLSGLGSVTSCLALCF